MADKSPPTYIEARIAVAAHTMLLPCLDGAPPMLIWSDRPIADGATDLFRSAIHQCKPVPTVLNRRRTPVPATA